VADVLVTGAAGFLGRQVCAALRARGVDFVPLVRNAADLRYPLAASHACWVHKPKTLIHLACPTPGGLGEMAKHPLLIGEMGVIDANIVEAAVREGVQRIIAVGSLCSYDPFDSINGPYGVAKRYLHALLEAAWRERGVPYTFLELTNLYGPGDRSQHVIPATIRKIQSALPAGKLTVWGDGNDERAFCYVEDAAAAIVKALDDTGVHADVLGPLHPIGIWEIVKYLRKGLGHTGKVHWDIQQPSLTRVTPPSTRSAPRLTTIQTGLTNTVNWWLAHPEETQP
jgi:GDP-L-fucose synthase